MIGQMLESIWAGFKVGIDAFLSLFPFYQQISDFKTQLIAAAIGIPEILLSIGGIIFTCYQIYKKYAWYGKFEFS